ncbi:hypothetical protein ACI797_03100 [Geodermatophilus sp. SYSU D00691]
MVIVGVMAADQRAVEDVQRLSDRIAVMSPGAAQDRARSLRGPAQVLREQAAAERQRAADRRRTERLRVGPAAERARFSPGQLQAAEARATNLEKVKLCKIAESVIHTGDL